MVEQNQKDNHTNQWFKVSRPSLYFLLGCLCSFRTLRLWSHTINVHFRKCFLLKIKLVCIINTGMLLSKVSDGVTDTDKGRDSHSFKPLIK